MEPAPRRPRRRNWVAPAGSWRLSALDASFLWLEHDGAPLHVGTMLILAGPAPTGPHFDAIVAARLAGVPWCRYRVVRMPMDLGRPVWADTAGQRPLAADPTTHCHHIALAAGQALPDLVAEIMSQPLDRAHPLWQLWQVTGLPAGQWAVIGKAHHAMVDGVTGADLISHLLSPAPGLTPATSPVVPGPGDGPGPAPTPVAVATAGARWAVTLPVRALRAAARAGIAPQQALARARQLRFGARQFVHADLPASILNGPLGGTRDYLWADADISAARAVAGPLGASLNDWFLAVVAGTLHRYLAGRGEPFGVVRALVPVAGRAPGMPTRPGNLTSVMFAILPVAEPDPARRLAAIARDTTAAKRRGVPQATAAVAQAADHIPAALLARVAARYARARQGRVNVAASNVVGPAQRSWLGDSEVLEMVPLLPVALDVRAVFSMVSYAGRLTVGLTADRAGLPHRDELRAALRDAVAELATVPPRVSR